MREHVAWPRKHGKTSLLDYVNAYYEEHGEAPTLWQLLMFREAEASVRLDREEDDVVSDSV